MSRRTLSLLSAFLILSFTAPSPAQAYVAPDSDNDGLLDSDELRRGTDPVDSDTDCDQRNDGEEVDAETNPLGSDLYLVTNLFPNGASILLDDDPLEYALIPVDRSDKCILSEVIIKASRADNDSALRLVEYDTGTNVRMHEWPCREVEGNNITYTIANPNPDLQLDPRSDEFRLYPECSRSDPTWIHRISLSYRRTSPYVVGPDNDLDQLANNHEAALGTDPDDPDTDGDGVNDGEEILNGTDPLDGLSNDVGQAGGSQVTSPDSDGDGLTDAEELALGTDPFDADDVILQGSATDGFFGCGRTRASSGGAFLLMGSFLLLLGLQRGKEHRARIIIMMMLAIMISPSAWALDVQLFKPVPDRAGVVSTYGAGDFESGEYQFGGYFNYVENPIEFGRRSNDARLVDVVDALFTTDVLFSMGATDYLSFHLGLPIHVTNMEAVGTIGESGTKGDIGDIRLSALYRIWSNRLEVNDVGWGFAVVPFLTLPSGQESRFIGEANLTGGVRLVTDVQLAPRHYVALNLGAQIREREELFNNLIVDDAFLVNAAYVFTVSHEYRTELFLEVFGSTTFREFASDEVSSPFEMIGGVRARWLDDRLSLSVGGGRGFNNGYGAPEFRVFSGLTFASGERGVIPPPVEPTPTPTPEPEPEPVLAPPPPVTGDLQLLVQNEAGEPVPAQLMVKDEAGNIVYEGTIAAKDNTFQPAKYKATIEAEGYRSQTRTFDIAAGTTTKERITMIKPMTVGDRIELIGNILFDFDKSTIKESTRPVVDKVAEVLQQHDEITKTRIEAHTDSVGEETYNQDLSDRRAKSVLTYLVDQGINPDRLSSIGHGESKPVASNATAEGREANRRVEFVVLKTQPQ